jgi:hypothetical protein
MDEIKSTQKLKGSDNYKVWSIPVSNALRAKGVFGYAQGIVPQPSTDDQSEYLSSRARQKFYDWEDRDAITINIITLTLSPDIIISTELYTTSKEL